MVIRQPLTCRARSPLHRTAASQAVGMPTETPATPPALSPVARGRGRKLLWGPTNSIHAPHQMRLVQDRGGDFLDGLGGRVEKGDPRLAHQRFRRFHLVTAVVG